MVNFRIDEAFLVAAVLEGALWGIYTAIFIGFLSIVKRKKTSRERYNLVNTIAIAMYILATVHFSLAFRRLIEAFIIYIDVMRPIDYYSQYSPSGKSLNAAKEAVYLVISVLGDTIVVWRCNAVWGRRYFYVTLIPALLIVCTAIGGIGGLVLQMSPNPNFQTVLSFGSMLFFSSFLTNSTATILLAGRIWALSRRNNRDLGERESNRFFPMLLLVIETGSFISAYKIVEFTLYRIAPILGSLPGNNAVYILFDTVPQVVGIFPTLIIILVATGYTSLDKTKIYDAKLTPIAFRSGSSNPTMAETGSLPTQSERLKFNSQSQTLGGSADKLTELPTED